jgi:hypothetical protein
VSDELLERAFAALGPAPSWRELGLVADTLRASGDGDVLEALEAAASGGQEFDALVELAREVGSSGFVALDLVTEIVNPGRARRNAGGRA